MKLLLFFQLSSAYNHFEGSWTKEEADAASKCLTNRVNQETANFDNCVAGDVFMNSTAPYDFNSIMHYDLKKYVFSCKVTPVLSFSKSI